jgi:hypothetical protein
MIGQKSSISSYDRLICWFAALVLFAGVPLIAQEAKKAPPQPGPMLTDGLQNFESPEFQFALVRSSQTISALHPKQDLQFDFTPGDRLTERSRDGYYHLGDIDIRLRTGEGEWKDYSTAIHRSAVKAIHPQDGVFAAADLSDAFSGPIPLRVMRTWSIVNGKLTLHYTLTNPTTAPIEIGGLGVPMVFNNDMNERTLEQAHAICSFADPYIGQKAGYLQVTRLNGHGPALLVIPDGNTSFEAYKPILNPHWRRGQEPKP